MNSLSWRLPEATDLRVFWQTALKCMKNVKNNIIFDVDYKSYIFST
jgi:hypothetical protein